MADDLSRFEIRELTGSQRWITLSGRAMPYRGIAWGMHQRTKKSEYAGNPVATIQVLGPGYDDTHITGTWKERFIRETGAVNLVGFDDLAAGDTQRITVEQLCAAFERVQQAGNALQVQNGRWLREGILKSFVPTPGLPNGSDVQWELIFEWSKRDEVATTAASSPPNPRGQLRNELANTASAASARPRVVRPDIQGIVRGAMQTSRTIAGQMFDTFRQTQALVTKVTAELAAANATQTEQLRTTLDTERTQIGDVPRTSCTDSDQVVDLMAVETWRRTLSYQQEVMRNGAMQRARNMRDGLVPGALQIVTVPGDTTLRKLSTAYYGTADSWQVIADANGFHDSFIARGTIVVIPPLGTG